MEDLKARLRREEGYRTHLYEDSVGVLTIGVGYNIEDKGLPPCIIEQLLTMTIAEAQADAWKIPEYTLLSKNRRTVLEAMVFQLGLPGVLKFKNMRRALAEGDYVAAATEMMDSKWYRQTPGRAQREATIMRRGE